jgi:hypothetical protein
MNYRELQQTAKSLGLPYIGIPRNELESSIARKQGSSPSSVSASTLEAENIKPMAKAKSKDSKPAEPVVNKEGNTDDFNTAIVYDNTREVRRYTKKSHGDSFAELANKFADKKDYKVELKNVKPGIKCPHCGRMIHKI